MVKDRDYDDQRDEPTKRLEQDYDTPFTPADDTGKQRLPKDHPVTDSASDIDAQELYDEGPDDAATDNPPTGDRGAGPGPRKVF